MIKSNSLSLDIQSHLPAISPPCRSPMEGNIPSARYTKLSEILRKTTTSQLQCSMFCGGRKCKYEAPTTWSEEEKALPALYSHWVTEDILATARPNNSLIRQFKLIESFKKNDIKTILNLQEPGEHASCGSALDPSGFSYDPKLFMEKQIYFYNFPWPDFSPPGRDALLDMVKVVSFALSQGKIAIHCHAGLGRTGTVIAAYLIFTYRCQAHSAIQYVRMRRPNSIQSRGQILSLFKFANYISPCFIVYKTVSSKQISVTLGDFLKRQRTLLHGEELRNFRYIPKVLFIICEKLIKRAGKTSILTHPCDEQEEDYGGTSGANFTRNYLASQATEAVKNLVTEESEGDSESEDKESKESDSINNLNADYTLLYDKDNFPVDLASENVEMDEKVLINTLADLEREETLSEVEYLSAESLAKHRPSWQFRMLQKSLLTGAERTTPPEVVLTVLTSELKSNSNYNNLLYGYQKQINNSPTGWETLCEIEDLEVLAGLFWTWFENLDSPILNSETIGFIVDSQGDPLLAFFNMDTETRFTMEYLARFVSRLIDPSEEGLKDATERLMARLVAALSLKRVKLDNGETIPKQKQTWLTLSSRSREAIFSLLNRIAGEAPL